MSKVLNDGNRTAGSQFRDHLRCYQVVDHGQDSECLDGEENRTGSEAQSCRKLLTPNIQTFSFADSDFLSRPYPQVHLYVADLSNGSINAENGRSGGWNSESILCGSPSAITYVDPGTDRLRLLADILLGQG